MHYVIPEPWSEALSHQMHRREKSVLCHTLMRLDPMFDTRPPALRFLCGANDAAPSEATLAELRKDYDAARAVSPDGLRPWDEMLERWSSQAEVAFKRLEYNGPPKSRRRSKT